jgi:hypothetical protein
MVLAAALVCAVAWLAATRLPAEARFERWLRDQPGVVTVDLESSRALAAGDHAATVPRPSASVTMRPALTREVVGGFMRAFEGYAADHGDVTRWTVELVHGGDDVTVYGRPDPNTHALDVLAAVHDLPGRQATSISITPWPPHLTTTMASGSDLVATARAMAAVRPPTSSEGDDPWREVPVTITDGTSTVTAGWGATLTAGVDAAFHEAVRLEAGRRVTVAASRDNDGRAHTTLNLDQASPTAERTGSALSALGFGLANHGEAITLGDADTPIFDTDAWSRSAGAGLRAVPGVLAVALDPGDEKVPPSVDVRVTPAVPLARLAKEVPLGVERFEVHTSTAAPDYDRNSALPPDPETTCPSGSGGSLNLAYTGPPSALPAAADYLAAVRSAAKPGCLHWVEPVQGSRADSPYLAVRIPLQGNQWRPVIDVVVERRTRTDSAHPSLDLILPAPGRPWSTVLIARADEDEPTPSTLDAETPSDLRAAAAAIQPVRDYWHSRLRKG